MDEYFITVNGQRLMAYERPGKKLTLFFIHGNSSNANVFNDVWQHSALQGYHLLSIDLPGHGKSDYATNVSAYTISSLGKMIAEILRTKNFVHVILIGHSIGGHLALSALNFTDRVGGIALAGAAPVQGAADLSRAYIISEAVQTVFKAEASDREILDFCRNAVYREETMPILEQSFRETDRRFREQMGLELGRHFGSEQFRSEIGQLQRSGIPVCLIHGEKEKVVNRNYLSSLGGLNLFENKIHLISDAGHGVPFEAPEKYSRILADFAASVNPTRDR